MQFCIARSGIGWHSSAPRLAIATVMANARSSKGSCRRAHLLLRARSMVGPPIHEPRRARLLDQVREALWLRRYSPRTIRAYTGWIRRFILFSGKRHPRVMGQVEVTAFLSHLATAKQVSASTQNQALAALLFLYSEVLGQRLEWLHELVRAKRPQRRPVVLSPAEVASVLNRMHGTTRLMASLLYGAGLAPGRMLQSENQRCGPRAPRDSSSRRQRPEGSRDGSAESAHSRARAASGSNPYAAPCRSSGGVWPCGTAERSHQEIPERTGRMGLAVAIPSSQALHRSRHARTAQASPASNCASACDQSRGRGRWDQQAGVLPHAPSFVRDPSPRVRL
jgi:hypothetical protein